MNYYVLAASAAIGAFVTSHVIAQNLASPADWTTTVARAKKEGKVFFYSGSPQEHVERLANGFRKAYPEINVVVARGTTGQMMAKIDTERTAGIDESADVWIGAEKVWFIARAKDGALLKPVGPAVAGWPQQALFAETVVDAARFPFVIMYNTRLVSTPPQTYADLLRPEFKGKMGMTEAPGAVQLAYYEWIERTQGNDYLARLRSQGVKLFAGAPQVSQALAAGEVAVVPGVVTISNVRPLVALGAPVAYTMPAPALGGNYHMAAFAWSKRPNAALVLLDWLMSAEGQTVWHGTGESASPRTGIPGSLNYAAITPADLSEYTPEVFKIRVDRWNKIFRN